MTQKPGKRSSKRKEEIVDACESLYKTMDFKEITIKKIGEATSFTRTSIYNYFHTKEEIFLALLKREFERWTVELERETAARARLTNDEIAILFAESLNARTQLLKIISANHFDMEANSRLEVLIDFKVAYGNSMRAVENVLEKFRPDMDEERRRNFIYAFFPFLPGVYSYAFITEKQRQAMNAVDVRYYEPTLRELVFNCVRKLLS